MVQQSFEPGEIAYLEALWAEKDFAERSFEKYRAHLSQRYGLGGEDAFTRTGEILRHPSAAPAAVPAAVLKAILEANVAPPAEPLATLPTDDASDTSSADPPASEATA